MIKLLTVLHSPREQSNLTANLEVLFQVLNRARLSVEISNVICCPTEFWYFYLQLNQIKECQNYTQHWKRAIVDAEINHSKYNIYWDFDYKRVRFGAQSRFLDETRVKQLVAEK